MKKACFIIVTMLLLQITARSQNVESSNFVKEAYRSWNENNKQAAENKFRAAIEADSGDINAYIGLAYLQEFQYKYLEACQTFQNVIRHEKNIYPYLHATWHTPKIRQNIDNPESGVVNLMNGLCQKPDSSGILKAMANEVLGEYYIGKREFDKGKEHFKSLNAIQNWSLIGPFENIAASGYDKTFPPELGYDTLKIYSGKSNTPIQWFRAKGIRNDQWLEFRRYFAFNEAVYYANTFIYSPKTQKAQIRIGTSGSLKAFLNDNLILSASEETNNDLDTYIIETDLREGWNRLLIKCGFSELDRCNFMARITDPKGDPLEQIITEITTHKYPKNLFSPPPVIIDNFAEKYFKDRLADDPSNIGNMLLLADCYLRNDKAIEAELVLNKAIEILPNCAFLHYKLRESYRRGKKNDDEERALEKIYSLDKTIPDILSEKAAIALGKEDFTSAEELIKQLDSLCPGSELSFISWITLYSKKNLVDKIIEAGNKGFEKYPNKIYFAYLAATIAIHTTQKYDRAVEIMEGFIKDNYDITAIQYLISYYTSAGSVEKGIDLYRQYLDLDPTATGFYEKLAQIYMTMQEYKKSEESLKTAMDICPKSPLLWTTMAKNYLARNDSANARKCYQTAITYNKTDFESRDRLREIENKNPVFSNFSRYNIDSLIKNSPKSEDYPSDGVVYLLDDYNRVVYPGGASESVREELIKILNGSGIDDFKEYSISYNSYSQILIIEESDVIKPDGSKIKADVNSNQLVFKTLEPNDIIHVKWRLKNYYTGLLSGLFWDEYTFTGFRPSKIGRYSLLLPDTTKFKYKIANGELKPKVRKTQDGSIYEWTRLDQPALKFEAEMFYANDAAMTLYVSNIPDWGTISSWYSDLASAKVKSSYEIKAEVARLMRGNEYGPESEKIKIIYDYIIENIHYSYVAFRQSAFMPQKARDVLINKIGDCKDLSTLCVAMLKEIGVDAYYALVSTWDQGKNLISLPGINFNHVIVAVKANSGHQFLDLTAQNYPAGTVPLNDIDGYALLIKNDSPVPFLLTKDQFLPNNMYRNGKIEISENNDIRVEQNITRTGALTASYRAGRRNKDQSKIESELTEDFSSTFPNFHLNKHEIGPVDRIDPAISYTMDYSISSYMTDAGKFKIFKVPWIERLYPLQSLSYAARSYPLYYFSNKDTLVEEYEIVLPKGYRPDGIEPKVTFSCPAAEYSITYQASDEKLNITRKFIQKDYLIPVDGYEEFKSFYNNALKEDERQILLIKD